MDTKHDGTFKKQHLQIQLNLEIDVHVYCEKGHISFFLGKGEHVYYLM